MYAVWPDGSYCTKNEIEKILSWMSDDYELVPEEKLIDVLINLGFLSESDRDDYRDLEYLP